MRVRTVDTSRDVMASKRRLRRKSRSGKVTHDRPSALRHAWQLRRKGEGHVIAYKCRFGSHWHVGHASGERPR